MVSELSTRLLNLETKAGSANYTQFAKNNQISRQVWRQLAQAKRVSGYSANKESVHSNSAITSVEKEKRANLIGLASKKRKRDELHYQTASTRYTVTEGGHLCKHGLLGSSRALPHEDIDTKKTKLITVSKDNPYEEKTKKVDVYDPSIYAEMVQSSKQFYSLSGRGLSNDRRNAAQGREEGSNATNSTIFSKLSDPKSDDGTTYEIPARFEDSNQNDDIDHSESDVLKDANAKNQLTVEEAFNGQGSARLITKSEQPYIILHANAAFSRLSGIPSNKLVGHQLNSIMNAITLPSKSFQRPAFKDFVGVALKHTADSKCSEKSTESNYRLTYSKAYSGTRMTHLSIDIEKMSSVNSCGDYVALTG